MRLSTYCAQQVRPSICGSPSPRSVLPRYHSGEMQRPSVPRRVQERRTRWSQGDLCWRRSVHQGVGPQHRVLPTDILVAQYVPGGGGGQHGPGRSVWVRPAPLHRVFMPGVCSGRDCSAAFRIDRSAARRWMHCKGALAARNDGDSLRCRHFDGVLRVWDVRSGNAERSLENAHGQGTPVVAVSPAKVQSSVITAGKDGSVKVTATSKQERNASHQCHPCRSCGHSGLSTRYKPPDTVADR